MSLALRAALALRATFRLRLSLGNLPAVS